MATKLSDLATQAMDVGSNTSVSGKINTWLNWSIQEIWEDSLWEFRVREAAASLNFVAGDFQKQLAADFVKPKTFRITTSGKELRLIPIDKETLTIAVPNWKDTASEKRGTPRFWIKPIIYAVTGGVETKTLQVWPPADGACSVDYDYYASHPILGSNDFCQIPTRHDKVIIDRVLVYIRASEDEINLKPWEDRYIQSLKAMRSRERRHTGELLGWKSEIQIAQVLRALTGNANDLDIR